MTCQSHNIIQHDLMFLCFLQASSQCTTAMLTSERSPQSTRVTTAVMPETQDVDMTSWSEADFEEKCTYIVKDQPLEEETKNHGKTRAERSLPRNLALKRCQNSAEVQNEVTVCQYPPIHSSVLGREALDVLLSNFSFVLSAVYVLRLRRRQ